MGYKTVGDNNFGSLGIAVKVSNILWFNPSIRPLKVSPYSKNSVAFCPHR
jgi:hypothetical protein